MWTTSCFRTQKSKRINSGKNNGGLQWFISLNRSVPPNSATVSSIGHSTIAETCGPKK